MRIPDSPYEKRFSPAEVKELLADGWQQTHLHGCEECFGRGCENCFQTGTVGTFNKEGKIVFGSPSFVDDDSVGAFCRIDYFGLWDHRFHFTAQGCGGQSELIFTIPQMVKLMKSIISVLDGPNGNYNTEFGIEAKFRGPPAYALASLTKDRMTVAIIPNERQQKALKLLREAGLIEEETLLRSAFEHELFRGDEEENRKVREAVGEIKPGTIFARKGENAVINEVAIRVDPDKSLLNLK